MSEQKITAQEVEGHGAVVRASSTHDQARRAKKDRETEDRERE